jgi:DNA-binding NarL/FixJ family response regulator
MRTIVLVLKRDRSHAETIADGARAAWPAAEVIRCQRLAAARTVLAAQRIDWLVTGLGFDDGDAIALIRELGGREAPRVLVHTGRCAPRALAWLLQWPVRGIFESHSEAAGALSAALRAVAEGERYLSEGIRWARMHRGQSGLGLIAELSATEQLVLALIASARGLKETAADLAMTPEGVRDAVHRLHAKLGVHDLAQLISEALRLGLVRRAPHGLAAVGLPLLHEAWLAARRKFRPARTP